ncbi:MULTISPECIES: hypothetical protein [Sphingomonas]|jgi:hypothetical protein|uniref:Uncharacterized protein n=1 Tax=Sphingomonas leidyi TaxID=68569 RepID=A0A7X5UXY4_9SPHN|nr:MULTISPECIES: hypothetical protein [Sphingomonas]MBN8810927.1 hypothetical protein [Sphingomonas sp.]NIJ64325.1 hypothetical protein [Sphingomonas leidyi]
MFRAAVTALAAAMLVPLAALAADRDDGGLAPDFEGQVAYFGNYTGKTSVTADLRRREQTPCPYQDQRCYQQIVGGGVKVVLSFDGEHVTGFYYSVGGFEGPNGLREGTLIGRRTAMGCELYEADGTMWQATTCGSKGFQGQIVSVRGIPKQSEVSFSTVGMFVRDTGWITKLGEEEARRDRRINWLSQKIDGPGAPESRFRAAIELDSFSRHFRGIDMGRVSEPVRSGKPRKNREWYLDSSYTRQDGSTGNIRGVIYNDRLRCLQWDEEPCGPIHPPADFPKPRLDDDGGWLSRSPAPIVASDTRPMPRPRGNGAGNGDRY